MATYKPTRSGEGGGEPKPWVAPLLVVLILALAVVIGWYVYTRIHPPSSGGTRQKTLEAIIKNEIKVGMTATEVEQKLPKDSPPSKKSFTYNGQPAETWTFGGQGEYRIWFLNNAVVGTTYPGGPPPPFAGGNAEQQTPQPQ